MGTGQRCGGTAAGRNQAHEFADPEDNYLWAAGIWEENAELGPCYTMITTTASPLMSSIHDRMPALLREDEIEEWLAGTENRGLKPFTGPLTIIPCESPLVKRNEDDTQMDLF